VVLFAFVGIQMAWNLRPFLGDRNRPFRLIGHYQGNFYEAVIYAMKQLVTNSDSTAPVTPPAARNLEELIRGGDSTAAPRAQP
jgi:hypothetical protein